MDANAVYMIRESWIWQMRKKIGKGFKRMSDVMFWKKIWKEVSTLWQTNIALENHHFLIGDTSSNGGFSHCYVSLPECKSLSLHTTSTPIAALCLSQQWLQKLYIFLKKNTST